MLCRGAPRHAKAVVGEYLAGPGEMAHHAIEDAPARAVAVHAELEEMPQKTAALRHTETDRVPNLGIVRHQRVAGAFVAQTRDEIAHRGKADPQHPRLARLVPEFVDLERLEDAPFRQHSDRAVICKP